MESKMDKNQFMLKQFGNQFEIENNWKPPVIEDFINIPTGDMPGDKVVINEKIVLKANTIFSLMLEKLLPIMNLNRNNKVVISVYGGSGVGKSEIGSLLSYYLNELGIGSYVLSGDNYPRRIPKYNDAERYNVFMNNGMKGLISNYSYNDHVKEILKSLIENNQDSNPKLRAEYPWLEIYQEAGKAALKNYLGTDNEIDFDQLNNIIQQFKNGVPQIALKRMGREDNMIWCDMVDFIDKNVMVIEWTHGNNSRLEGVDIPILLNSTPQETLEHRKLRNRDKGVDSPFTAMILELEQELLHSQASKSKIIVSKSGEIISYEEYLKQMNTGFVEG